MPCFPFIFMVLFGVICGSRVVDNHMRSIYSASMNAAGKTALAGLPVETEQAVKRRDDEFLRALRAYNDDIDGLNGYGKTKRDFLNSHEILSLDSPPLAQLSVGAELAELDRDDVIKLTARASSPAVSYFDEYFEDRPSNEHDEVEKRAGSAPIGCDCKLKNDLLDLGQQHFPRYLLNAVCQTELSNDYPAKCRRGTHCKPLEYKVKVLTYRSMLDHTNKDPALAWLPDDLRQLWRFKTVTVAAGCFCSY